MTDDELFAIHQAYCAASGFDPKAVRYVLFRAMWRKLVIEGGVTKEEIVLVASYLRKQINAGKRNARVLLPNNFLKPEFFGNDLIQAQSAKTPPPRNPAVDGPEGWQKILRQLYPTAEIPRRWAMLAPSLQQEVRNAKP